MEALVAGDLRIEPGDAAPAGGYCLIWRGKSTDRNPGQVLLPYFTSVLGHAQRAGQPLEMHFQLLDHFNSSTITAIIQVIQEARSRGVKLVIVFNQALKWQKLSFDALRVLVKGDGLLELRSV